MKKILSKYRKPLIKHLVIVVGFTLIFLQPKILFSQQKLSLSDCLRLAFENSNLIKVSELSATIAEKQVAESKSQKIPNINLSTLYTRIRKISSFSIPMGAAGEKQTFKFGTPNRMNLDIKLQAPIFTRGRISKTISIAETGKKISNIQERQQIKNVTDQVLRAYNVVLLNQEIIRLNEANVERTNSHLSVTKERFESGDVPRLEMLRAQVQLKNAESSLEEAIGNLEKSKIFLGKVIGADNENFSLTDSFAYEPVSINKTDLIKKALAKKSNLQILQLQQEVNRNQIALAKSGNKPNVFLFSGYNVMNGFDPMDPEKFIDNYNAGIQLAIPLFDGFTTSHKVQQAKLAYQSAQIQEDEIRDLIRMQVRQNIISIEQARNKIAAQKENIVLANETLKVARKQYRDGVVSSLDVIDAQHILSQGELRYTQAIFNHIMAKLDLCKAIEDYSWFEASVMK